MSLFKCQIKYICLGSLVLELDSCILQQIWEGSVSRVVWSGFKILSSIAFLLSDDLYENVHRTW